ncbi:helix-turn-helix domain-containing protein [Streptomyces phytophilus]|uniref:helix-turn-helix domain-containing protein n=1 Tax=Streptomyces phytophilus TaxID=722715 RepID=UPI0015F0EB37|nr:helix-turn-helix transcriptional regulator [Streptomyces phytophilus]
MRQKRAAENVSRNIRRLRLARGWRQEDAGQRLGAVLGETWSAAVWSAAEQVGKPRQKPWTAVELVAMAALFGVTVGDLLTAPACRMCSGAPPAGFTCNACGARAVGGEGR